MNTSIVLAPDAALSNLMNANLIIADLALQSTLFNALCEGTQAQAANFPFCTIEPNTGIVAVSSL